MADNMNNPMNNTGARTGRRGLRARIGVGLLSLGLASGAGVMTMSAQPASAATIDLGTAVVVDAGTQPVVVVVALPGPGHRVRSMGVSWS